MIGFLLTLLTACSGGDDRPSDGAWRLEWDRQRQSIPDAETIIAGGPDLCAELLGDLRVGRPMLIPSPDEALDEPVDAWIAQAEKIAFECPDDPGVIGEEKETLDILAAGVDAGLSADSDQTSSE